MNSTMIDQVSVGKDGIVNEVGNSKIDRVKVDTKTAKLKS